MTMLTLVQALCGAALMGGLLLIVAGLRKTVPVPGRPPSLLRRRWARFSRRDQILLAVGAAIGVLLALGTGWLLAIVLIPAALVGIPWLLGEPGGRARIEKLEALEEWARSLAGLLRIRGNLEAALTASARTAPAPIHREVAQLGNRLRLRWSTEAALRAFAEDLSDSTGDLLVANLIQVSKVRGPGLVDTLDTLAGAVRDDVRARRQIESERSKTRNTVRGVTLITIGAVAVMLVGGGWHAYATPLGQLIFAVLAGVMVGLLAWLRQMASPQQLPRLLPASEQWEGRTR